MTIEYDAPTFIFACGRSGSTLIQRVLNTSEQIHIWGEHGGLLSQVAASFNIINRADVQKLIKQTPIEAHAKVLHSEPVLEEANWSVQWHNAMRRPDIFIAYRAFVERLFASGLKDGCVHWGFKEIRYGVKEARFLLQLFPRAKFIIMVRDPLEVLRSQMRHFYLVNTTEAQWSDANLDRHAQSALDSVAQLVDLKNSDVLQQCTVLRYEDLIANPAAEASRLATFIGVPGFVSQKIDAIFGENKAHKSGHSQGANQDRLQAWIRMKLDVPAFEGRMARLRGAFDYCS